MQLFRLGQQCNYIFWKTKNFKTKDHEFDISDLLKIIF